MTAILIAIVLLIALTVLSGGIFGIVAVPIVAILGLLVIGYILAGRRERDVRPHAPDPTPEGAHTNRFARGERTPTANERVGQDEPVGRD